MNSHNHKFKNHSAMASPTVSLVVRYNEMNKNGKAAPSLQPHSAARRWRI